MNEDLGCLGSEDGVIKNSERKKYSLSGKRRRFVALLPHSSENFAGGSFENQNFATAVTGDFLYTVLIA